VGVLVQTDFVGILSIAGVPVAKELGNGYLMNYLQQNNGAANRTPDSQTADGSIVIVVATDAPLDRRNLNRLARTGSSESNGSGDYAIAFSAAPGVRTQAGSPMYRPKMLLPNGSMSPLFEAVILATEEAIYNSMFRAHDMTGNGHTVKALPPAETIGLLRKHGAIPAK
jgi:D-aminopeptidase